VVSVLLEIGIKKGGQDPDLRSWTPEDLFKNGQNKGIILTIPVWLNTELWR
jgi:hypothetical protein